MTLHLLILLLSLSYITIAQNDTNETTTEMPETTPSTTYYTTTDLTTTELTTTSTTEITTDEPTRTLEPSLEPTLSPISDPSPSPTDAPNILSNNKNKKKGDAYLQKVKTKCISKIPGAITCNKVKGSQKDFWITAAKDVACVGATNDDDCIVDIGDCNDEYQEEEDTTSRRLLETSSNIIGVTITYLVVIRDPELVTSYEQRIENGKFNEEFSETVNDEYDDVEIDIEFEEATIGDPDEFLGNEDPTFGEIIASPYILLGIVCTIIGIIWLLFLRSSIENKYPSYLSQPASAPSMSGNAVEMVPQSSAAADAVQKQKNKQELQQAWNESDAE